MPTHTHIESAGVNTEGRLPVRCVCVFASTRLPVCRSRLVELCVCVCLDIALPDHRRRTECLHSFPKQRFREQLAHTQTHSTSTQQQASQPANQVQNCVYPPSIYCVHVHIPSD